MTRSTAKRRGMGMATNFRILMHQNDCNLHLKLTGDFDGSSAHQLLNFLKRYDRKFSTIFIHTGAVREIAPFGHHVFHENFGQFRKSGVRFVFTGDNASKLHA
jgi:anti-anti-sigma regulatory factor